jgi:hypothetical protein
MKNIFYLIASLCYVGLAHGQSPNQPIYVSASVAFGSVTASYTQFLAGGKPLVDVDILNNTDKDIFCTWDDTNPVEIPAYSSYRPNLGESRKYIQTALKCKHAGVAPTVGSVDIFGYY